MKLIHRTICIISIWKNSVFLPVVCEASEQNLKKAYSKCSNLLPLFSMKIKYKYIYVKRRQKNCKINNAADVDQLVGAELRKLDREHLLTIYLNRRNKVIDIEVVAICTLS